MDEHARGGSQAHCGVETEGDGLARRGAPTSPFAPATARASRHVWYRLRPYRGRIALFLGILGRNAAVPGAWALAAIFVFGGPTLHPIVMFAVLALYGCLAAGAVLALPIASVRLGWSIPSHRPWAGRIGAVVTVLVPAAALLGWWLVGDGVSLLFFGWDLAAALVCWAVAWAQRRHASRALVWASLAVVVVTGSLWDGVLRWHHSSAAGQVMGWGAWAAVQVSVAALAVGPCWPARCGWMTRSCCTLRPQRSQDAGSPEPRAPTPRAPTTGMRASRTAPRQARPRAGHSGISS